MGFLLLAVFVCASVRGIDRFMEMDGTRLVGKARIGVTTGFQRRNKNGGHDVRWRG